jgi:hypothetical protein
VDFVKSGGRVADAGRYIMLDLWSLLMRRSTLLVLLAFVVLVTCGCGHFQKKAKDNGSGSGFDPKYKPSGVFTTPSGNRS